MIYNGISFAEYSNLDGLNQSTLKEIVKNPALFKMRMSDNVSPVKTPSRAMVIGSAIDCLFFGGEAAFASRYCVAPEWYDGRTKRGKTWRDSVPQGAIIISRADANDIYGAVAALRINDLAMGLFNGADYQVAVQANINGVLCKGLLDAFKPSAHTICDLKSATDADPASVAKTSRRFKYYWQAAFYRDLVKGATGMDCGFFLVFVERCAPFRVEVFSVPADIIDLGRDEYMSALELYKQCDGSGVWPASSGILHTLTHPDWTR